MLEHYLLLYVASDDRFASFMAQRLAGRLLQVMRGVRGLTNSELVPSQPSKQSCHE